MLSRWGDDRTMRIVGMLELCGVKDVDGIWMGQQEMRLGITH